MGGFVLILKFAWGVLSTLYYWTWGVLSAFKKTCGGFCPPIIKWTWGVMSVGCFVRIPSRPDTHDVSCFILKLLRMDIIYVGCLESFETVSISQ